MERKSLGFIEIPYHLSECPKQPTTEEKQHEKQAFTFNRVTLWRMPCDKRLHQYLSNAKTAQATWSRTIQTTRTIRTNAR